jgi:hypothetical protein
MDGRGFIPSMDSDSYFHRRVQTGSAVQLISYLFISYLFNDPVDNIDHIAVILKRCAAICG